MSKKIVLAGALGVAAAALVPAPALARGDDFGPGDAAASDMARAADELSSPRNQRAVAGMMAAMTEMMLSMKVAPLAKAMESMGDHGAARRIPDNATLADLAGPDARHLPREVSRKVPQMMGAMAGMSGVIGAMLPQLRGMAERMKDQMDGAMRAPTMDGSEGSDPDRALPPAGEATEE